MILNVDPHTGTVQLNDPDDFTTLRLECAGDHATVTEALAARGRPAEEDDHVWIDISAFAEFAGDARTPAWDEGFAAMVDYATSKGWTDADGTHLKVHIVTS